MPRKLSWDWYDGELPDNAEIDETAYIETSFSFVLYRSRAPVGVSIGRGASTYLGTMFDVGPRGSVSLGEYTLVHGARIICDARIEIGDYSLLSWNVVLMDTYRLPREREARRAELRKVPARAHRYFDIETEARPVTIGSNVWIGFDACVLPGVSIGEGSIVGARSVVVEDIPPYTIAAGNPARIIRQIESRPT
jgi:acetyltransferase-like isoleucine patch superfamily enzyme